MKNCLHILQIIPELQLGGAQIMCENLSMELKALGHNVTIVSLYSLDTHISKRLSSNGIEILYVNKKIGFDYSILSKLRIIIKNIHPDIIQTHLHVLRYVVPASIGLNITIIHTLHSVASKEDTRFGRFLNSFFFKIFRVIPVALSELVRETIQQEYNIPSQNIPIIYNGIPIYKCIPKQNYKFSTSLINVIHVGRLSLPKNHTVLIKAFKSVHEKYPHAVLWLVGDGELEKQILAQIESENMSQYVIMKGATDNVYSVLADADIFVLPSIYEGMPMTLIEAMGSGLPIIASKVGGIPNMITDGVNGLLIEPNEKQIADGIIKLIENETLRAELGINALASIQPLSSKTMAQNYINLYLSKIK